MCVQYSLTERTVPVPRSVPGKTLRTVPVSGSGSVPGPPCFCQWDFPDFSGIFPWEIFSIGLFPLSQTRMSGGHSRGYPGPKLRSGHSKSWKNKHLGADIHDPKARTSRTLRDFHKLRSENFGLNFRSLQYQ